MTQTIETEKLTETVGADVLGIDVDALLHDDDLPAWTLEALEANGVLVFRGPAHRRCRPGGVQQATRPRRGPRHG